MAYSLVLIFIHTKKTFVSNSGEPDQAPRTATPDLSLLCNYFIP